MTALPTRSAWPPGAGTMAELVRTTDWSGTALGEAGGWPPWFRTAVEICLSSAFPCLVAWGDDLLQIYNDAAIALVDPQHPVMLGQPLRAFRPGIGEILQPLAEHVLLRGETVSREDVAGLPGMGAPGRARFTVSCSPLRDETGRVRGIFSTVIETVRRVQVKDDLHRGETDGDFLLAVADHMRPLTDPQAILLAGAEALRRHLGLAAAGFEALDGQRGARGIGALTGLRPAQDALSRDEEVLFGDGEAGGAATASIPLYRGGAVAALFLACRSAPGPWTRQERWLVREVAERSWEAAGRASAEIGARGGQREFRSLLEGIPQIVWRAAGTGDRTWSSPQWSTFTGQSEAAARGRGWLAAVHPDDRDGVMAAWCNAGPDGILQAEFRLLRKGVPEADDLPPGAAGPAEPQYRWFQARAAPVRDENGVVLEWLGTCTDVDDLRRMEQHQRLLLAELQHRVRNTLSVIRAIIRRTVQASESVDELAMHLDGRIDAFSRVQAAVTRNPERGIDLAQLVADELRAHSAREGKRVRIEGVAVTLRPKAAETLALAIHELATNAVKFGALAQPQGRVEVAWSVQPAAEVPRLLFTWRESGVPPSQKTSERRGFGTDMFERTLPYELDAEVTRNFTPEGLHCTIAIPLSSRLVKEQTLRELGIAASPI